MCAKLIRAVFIQRIAPVLVFLIEQAVGFLRSPGAGGIGVDVFPLHGPEFEDGIDHAPGPADFVKLLQKAGLVRLDLRTTKQVFALIGRRKWPSTSSDFPGQFNSRIRN